MVNLELGANETISNLLNDEEINDIYTDLIEQVENNHPTIFVQLMQNYIINIAISISKVVSTPKLNLFSYLSSLDYLCLKLMHDNKLYNSLASLPSLVNNDTLINDVLIQYNYFIKKLIMTTDLPSLNSCVINPSEMKKEPNRITNQDKAIDNKDELCGKTKIHIDLEKEYLYDPYNKIYQFKLNVEWKELGENEYLYLSVFNTYTNKYILEKVKLKSLKEGKGTLDLNLRDYDVDDKLLSLYLTIEKNKEYVMKYKIIDGYDKKGILFKKKVEKFHYQEEKISEKSGILSFNLSKHLLIENNKYGKFKG
jgi:hypothetical protein